ncbi:hypothetical protein AOQ84DRAFT_374605 [Glonium stellatum]|uniref:Uncharacterized protein n=1 Tax=Glonium stellatum TaxID=574774 RepID=A0A8E2F572_9PEZI|nr:hypothetical protein AOQ84DRAFT_374605 [Glonium stellatum]
MSIPILPSTPYQDDDSQVPRSTGFVTAQRRILEFQLRFPHRELTVGDARGFTSMISPHGFPSPRPPYPSVNEAIRMCYYMRELGYNTFVELKPAKKEVWLILRTRIILTQRDQIYWVQNWESGVVRHM